MKKFIFALVVFVILVGLFLNFKAYTSTDTKIKISTEDIPGVSDNTSAYEVNSEDWILMLVNSENPLPDTYVPKLESLSNGLKFDTRAIGQLNAMLSDARAQGLSPVVCSAYRTFEYQRKLFDKQIKKQMSRGLSRKKAEIEARKVVAYPGTSEHHTGLAVDIVASSYQHLDDAQGKTAEIKWITEHCSEYGFILRYPKNKTDITDIIYEPWHFRYVGIDTAKTIMESGECLEEYLEHQS